MIQDDLVEVPPTRLPPDVFLHHVSAQLVQVDGVGERFAGGLDAELVVNISNVEPLAVDGAETDRPLGGVSPGQLGDVLGRGPAHVGSTLVVNAFDVESEVVKLGDHQLPSECLRDEDVALLDKPREPSKIYSSQVNPVLLVELILVQFDVIYSKPRGIQPFQHCNHVGHPGILSLNTHSLQLL